MPWQPHPDRNEAVQAVDFRDVPQAVRRVCQPVEEHDRAKRLAIWLEDEGPVQSCRKWPG